MFFTDETGFNLTPSIPYGWQPKGEQIGIRSSKTKVTNVFGLLSRKGILTTYSTPKSINSDFIIACVDEVASAITRPTVLVMDNAPWHTSEKLKARQKMWEEKELYIYFLPTYSPHLNSIETLWRKMKHEWLRAKDYESAAALKDAIFNIIREYGGDKYNINFSKNFLDADLSELCVA